MKASFYTESILYWLVKGVSWTAQKVSPNVSVQFGKKVGGLAYHLLPRRRTIALANLRAAFGDEYSPDDYRRIIHSLFEHLGMMLLEIVQIPRIDQAYMNQWIHIAPGSRERLEAAFSKGNGVIFLTGHFGNWELISLTGALNGYPTLVLIREQGWPRLNNLLTQYRESKGCRMIRKGFPIRELIRGLQQGKIVGILADQDGGARGVLAPFLGRLSSTASGPIALSLETGAPILPVFVVRRNGPTHWLVVEDPLVIPEMDSFEQRVQAGIEGYLSVLEKYIRQTPSQWLWFHRRWKSTPERRILIFSDGKAGHLHQSKACARWVEKAWEIRTRKDQRLRDHEKPLCRVETVNVSFRNPFRRAVAALMATACPHRFSGGDVWLRWSLTPESYRAIRSAYADVSISCGASTASVHLLWAWTIRSKTIHITRSRFPSWKRFDLAVIPRHDQVAATNGARPLIIDGALVPDFSEEPRQKATETWSRRLRLQKKVQIGFLLGGPTRGIDISLKDVQHVVEDLLLAADRLDAELLVTSSRRTPSAIEIWLDKKLSHHPRCRLLTLVNQRRSIPLENPEDAIPCILDVARVVVVSGDSISMVSEALAQSKSVISFCPIQKKFFSRRTKHHRFLQELASKELIKYVTPDKVGAALLDPTMAPEKNGSLQKETLLEELVRWL